MDLLKQKKDLLRTQVQDLSSSPEVSLSQLGSLMGSGRVGLYRPLSDEPKLVDLPEDVDFCWPFIKNEEQFEMAFSLSSGGFSKTALGFEQPLSITEVPKNEINAILVPGQAFDMKGNRLGRGRGYYDRYLSDFKGVKIGVCSSKRLLDEVIPVDPKFDVAVEFVLTEQFLYKVNPYKEVV